jgi:hypothetical protein
MNWDSGLWDTGFWDQPGPVVPATYFLVRTKHNNTSMKKNPYYPSRIASQANWLANYSIKLPIHGPILGLAAAEVSAAVNDAKWGHYILSEWVSTVRTFEPATTDAMDAALTGASEAAVTLPTFVAPPLPAGVVAAPAGLLNRIFALNIRSKATGTYTEAIGADLGIIGQEDTAVHPAPKVNATVEQGPDCQCVRIGFYKYGHMGIYLEGRRGAAWEFLAIETNSPYVDLRPLLNATQPEIREYRMRFWDKGTPNGDWTDVLKVTVSP